MHVNDTGIRYSLRTTQSHETLSDHPPIGIYLQILMRELHNYAASSVHEYFTLDIYITVANGHIKKAFHLRCGAFQPYSYRTVADIHPCIWS